MTAARFQGTIHDFVMLNMTANTAASRGAMAPGNRMAAMRDLAQIALVGSQSFIQ